MAAMPRFCRLATSAFRRCGSGGHIRAFSVLTEVADLQLPHITDVADLQLPRHRDVCYIVGKNGPMKLSAHRVMTLGDYFKEMSLLDRAPTDRLIEDIDEKFPFLTPERIRKLVRSGLLPLFYSKLCGMRISESDFTKGNIGFIPSLDLLVFRSLNMSLSLRISEVDNCYQPFLKLFKSLVCKYVGPQALSQLPKSWTCL